MIRILITIFLFSIGSFSFAAVPSGQIEEAVASFNILPESERDSYSAAALALRQMPEAQQTKANFDLIRSAFLEGPKAFTEALKNHGVLQQNAKVLRVDGTAIYVNRLVSLDPSSIKESGRREKIQADRAQILRRGEDALLDFIDKGNMPDLLTQLHKDGAKIDGPLRQALLERVKGNAAQMDQIAQLMEEARKKEETTDAKFFAERMAASSQVEMATNLETANALHRATSQVIRWGLNHSKGKSLAATNEAKQAAAVMQFFADAGLEIAKYKFGNTITKLALSSNLLALAVNLATTLEGINQPDFEQTVLKALEAIDKKLDKLEKKTDAGFLSIAKLFKEHHASVHQHLLDLRKGQKEILTQVMRSRAEKLEEREAQTRKRLTDNPKMSIQDALGMGGATEHDRRDFEMSWQTGLAALPDSHMPTEGWSHLLDGVGAPKNESLVTRAELYYRTSLDNFLKKTSDRLLTYCSDPSDSRRYNLAVPVSEQITDYHRKAFANETDKSTNKIRIEACPADVGPTNQAHFSIQVSERFIKAYYERALPHAAKAYQNLDGGTFQLCLDSDVMERLGSIYRDAKLEEIWSPRFNFKISYQPKGTNLSIHVQSDKIRPMNPGHIKSVKGTVSVSRYQDKDTNPEKFKRDYDLYPMSRMFLDKHKNHEVVMVDPDFGGVAHRFDAVHGYSADPMVDVQGDKMDRSELMKKAWQSSADEMWSKLEDEWLSQSEPDLFSAANERELKLGKKYLAAYTAGLKKNSNFQEYVDYYQRSVAKWEDELKDRLKSRANNQEFYQMVEERLRNCGKEFAENQHDDYEIQLAASQLAGAANLLAGVLSWRRTTDPQAHAALVRRIKDTLPHRNRLGLGLSDAHIAQPETLHALGNSMVARADNAIKSERASEKAGAPAARDAGASTLKDDCGNSYSTVASLDSVRLNKIWYLSNVVIDLI